MHEGANSHASSVRVMQWQRLSVHHVGVSWLAFGLSLALEETGLRDVKLLL